MLLSTLNTESREARREQLSWLLERDKYVLHEEHVGPV